MRYRSLLSSLTVLVAVLVGAGACSNQGEGQRCDKLNNSNDCSAPNICTTGLASVPKGAAICCPPPNTPITVAACNAGVATELGDAGPVRGTDAGSHRDASTKDGSR